jgi:hypothetical protein
VIGRGQPAIPEAVRLVIVVVVRGSAVFSVGH